MSFDGKHFVVENQRVSIEKYEESPHKSMQYRIVEERQRYEVFQMLSQQRCLNIIQRRIMSLNARLGEESRW